MKRLRWLHPLPELQPTYDAERTAASISTNLRFYGLEADDLDGLRLELYQGLASAVFAFHGVWHKIDRCRICGWLADLLNLEEYMQYHEQAERV